MITNVTFQLNSNKNRFNNIYFDSNEYNIIILPLSSIRGHVTLTLDRV